MRRKFNSALIGYRLKDVDEKVTLLKEQYKNTMAEYENEQAKLLEEKRRLENEIEALESKLGDYRIRKRKLEEMMYDAFMEASLKVYRTEEQFDHMIQHKTQILKKQKDMNENMKHSTKKLLDQLKTISEG